MSEPQTPSKYGTSAIRSTVELASTPSSTAASPMDESCAKEKMKRLLEGYKSSSGEGHNAETPSKSKLKLKLKHSTPKPVSTTTSVTPSKSASATQSRNRFTSVNKGSNTKKTTTAPAKSNKSSSSSDFKKVDSTKSDAGSAKDERNSGDDDGEDEENDDDTNNDAATPAGEDKEVVEWECTHDPNGRCNLGQTILKRNKYGRKTISNFIGRNKKATRLVPDGIRDRVWMYRCRKHYQQETYRLKKPGMEIPMARWYKKCLYEQLQRIQTWRPEAKFMVGLMKAANDRIHEYNALLAKNISPSEAQKKMLTKEYIGKKHPNLTIEQAFPLIIAQDFKDRFEGTDKTYDDLYRILEWVERRFQAQSLTMMPPMEFLIQDPDTKEDKPADPRNIKALTKERLEQEARLRSEDEAQRLMERAEETDYPTGEEDDDGEETEADEDEDEGDDEDSKRGKKKQRTLTSTSRPTASERVDSAAPADVASVRAAPVLSSSSGSSTKRKRAQQGQDSETPAKRRK